MSLPEFSFIGLSSDGKSPALHVLYGPNESVTIELTEDKALALIEGLVHFISDCRAHKKETQ